MFVYLMQSGTKKTDPIKVGYSQEPETRLKQLQTGNPIPLKLIMKIKCDDEKHARRLEKSLHEMLSTQNVFLEWYTLKGSHIRKMLTAFANNEEFDQVEHCENLTHYSRMPAKNKINKKYKNLKKHVVEMEIATAKRREELKFVYGYIYNEFGVSTKEIKELMVEKLDK